MSIIAGDTGTLLSMVVRDGAGIVDLSTVTSIIGTFLRGTRTFTKTVTVDEAEAGTCSTVLTSTDVASAGIYAFQITITFSDGDTFTSDMQRFTVGEKLSA